jgi:hypothetical protein
MNQFSQWKNCEFWALDGFLAVDFWLLAILELRVD